MSTRALFTLLALAGLLVFAFPAVAEESTWESQEPRETKETGKKPAASDSSPRSAASPPYFKPEYAVAVNAATHGEGNFVLAAMSAEERRKLLETGLVLADDRKDENDEVVGFIRAWVIADQPRDKVFELLIQPSAQDTFLPRLVSSETVKRTSNTELTKFHIRVAMVNVHTHVLHQWWPEVSRLAWALDPNFDNGVRHQEGFWNVYSLDENTSLLEYGTVLQTSALVPRFVQDRLTRSDLPGALEAMKKYLDSGGTWRR